MLHKNLALLFALLGALSGSLLAADEPPVAQVPVLEPKYLVTVLDSRAEPASRQAALAAIQKAADAGNSYAMYNLGTLSRQSRFKDDGVVKYDPGAALMWLTRSFDAGRISAAFKIAVVHRELGDPLEAMGWLQVYNYYVKGGATPRPEKEIKWLRRGPVADLMAKLQDDLKGTDEATIKARTIALLGYHGVRFEAAPRTPLLPMDDCDVKRPPKGFRASIVHPVQSSMVELVAVVEADGSARDVFVLDSTPDAMTVSGMRQYGFNVFCPKSESPDARHVFLNWNFINAQNANRMR